MKSDPIDSKYNIREINNSSNKKRNRNKRRGPNVNNPEPSNQPDTIPQESPKKSGKGKTQYTDLFAAVGADGEDPVVLLPGRNLCDCEARRHTLVNNCLKCGRIVCVQEGSGPCMFCGELVCTADEMAVLRTDSRKALELQKRFFGMENENAKSAFTTISAGLEKAMAQKDKLLQFDKDSVRRTRVIDDQSDYYNFEQNPFLSAKQREELRKKKEELLSKKNESRRDAQQKITLDFMGRQVLSNEHEQLNELDPFNTDKLTQSTTTSSSNECNIDVDNMVKQFNDVQFNPSVVSAPNKSIRQMPTKFSGRLQGGDLEATSSDEGWCISVQQPFASLLVLGIKIHEGRSWYTAHRGRLWIAASAKQPDPAWAHGIEKMYAQLWNGRPPAQFPDQWATGCLMGCVDVIDCLAQEQYRMEYPNGECEDPYVFICDNARELTLKFPVRGRPSMFQLDITNLKAAQNILFKSTA